MAHTTVRYAEFGIADHIQHFVADLRAALVQRFAYNRTYAELSALTDRELADIGLRRSDIAEVAAKAIQG